ncbi:MAG: Trk family potassium uptake protein [Solobacterium sp.]|nr:Trk family potassium uptake protein [Solobacterium sp.]
MKELLLKIRHHANSFRTIILGFFLLILTGAILLSLPFASVDGYVPFTDALFTSASASCVTGLVVFNTATKWTLFGKTVILILIQIGGLGVITALILTMVMTGRKIGLMERLTMQDAISAHQTGGIVRFTIFLFLGTALIELLGTLCLMFVFVPQFGWLRGSGYALFHSISAFCNAGFDLLGFKEPFVSLTAYSDHVMLNIVICALIVIGGIGFLSWRDFLEHKFRFKSYRLQTKVILATTAVLLLVPFLYFFFSEFRDYEFKERFLLSIFQSVTPRTAGFNTYDYGKMSETGLLLSAVLMMIGGAPGSTAGGLKLTTIFILAVSTSAFLRKKKEVNAFHRRIEADAITNAMTLSTVYMGLLIGGTFIISSVEGVPVLSSMFECASALGTVGLTTGITPGLHIASKLLLTGYMFFGRVGGMTLAYALITAGRKDLSRYPAEKLTVG